MDLRGIYPALVSAFKKDGSFDFDMLRRLIRDLIGKKVRGFYVGGSSSELFSLTLAERKQIMEIAREEAGTSCAVIAHVGAMNPAEAKELARHAKAAGCDAISAIPPFYGKYSWAETAAYYLGLVEASGLKMFLYNIPAFTGVSLSVEGYRELAATGGIAGLKHTCHNLYEMDRFREASPEGAILIGHDEIFAAALAMGADGIIGAGVNLFPVHYRRIHAYMEAGNHAAARLVQSAINDLFETFMEIGFFPSVKHLLRHRGFDVGDCRPPVLPLRAEQRKRLEESYGRCERKTAAIAASHPL